MIAYELARKDLRGFLPLSKQLASGADWLAVGAALSFARRAGRPLADLGRAPDWSLLSKAEQNGLDACWRIMGPEGADALDVAEDYPFLLPQMKALEQSLAPMRKDPCAAKVTRTRLRCDSMRRTDYNMAVQDYADSRDLHQQIAHLLDICAALEARYGARRDALPDPRGFQLSVLEADTDWLARHRDPDFWHILLPTLVELSFVANFARQVLPVLDWILSQPDCDRATAAAGFIMLDGPSLAPLAPGQARGWEQQAERQGLCHAIAQRAGQGLYTSQRLRPSCLGLEDDLTDAAGGESLPSALFAKAFSGAPPRTPFYLDDGTIYMAML